MSIVQCILGTVNTFGLYKYTGGRQKYNNTNYFIFVIFAQDLVSKLIYLSDTIKYY